VKLETTYGSQHKNHGGTQQGDQSDLGKHFGEEGDKMLRKEQEVVGRARARGCRRVQKSKRMLRTGQERARRL
jgi:hypothetical protein